MCPQACLIPGQAVVHIHSVAWLLQVRQAHFGKFDQHISLLVVIVIRRLRWVGLSATFEPCTACGSAVALSWRNMRLSVQPSFPHRVWALAFYAVLQLPAAVLACCRDGLDLGVLPPVTIFPRPNRCPASGLGLHSSVGKPSLDRDFCTLAHGVQISTNMC